MESNTKTIAKRARVGPRTPVVLTMENMFLMEISSISCLGSPIIFLDNVLKIWIELLTLPNDNARERFHGLWWFPKVQFLGRNFEKIEKY